MKRFFSLTLALLMAALLFAPAPAARAEEDPNTPYEGLWRVIRLQSGDTDIAPEDAGLTVYFDFRPSGAIYAVRIQNGKAEENYFAYSVSGENTLYLFEDDEYVAAVYDPAAGTIITEKSEDFVAFTLQRVTEEPLPDLTSMVDRSGEAQTYYIYQMMRDGQTVNMLEALTTMVLDVDDFFITLSPDGTGYLQFGEEEAGGEITWDESSFTAEGESVPYTRQGDHILLDINGQIAEFAPEGEVEALLERMEGLKKIAEPPTGSFPEKLTGEALAGQWALTTITYNGVTVPVSALNMEMTMVFSADGSIQASYKEGDDAEEAPMTYELTGDTTLIIRSQDGEALDAVYDPATGRITVLQEDNNMILERSDGLWNNAPEASASKADVSEEYLLGDWEMVRANVSGITVPASQIGTTMALTLKEDGTAVFSSNGSVNDIQWDRTEEGVALRVGTISLYTLTYDGEILTLSTMGVDMIFEKKN